MDCKKNVVVSAPESAFEKTKAEVSAIIEKAFAEPQEEFSDNQWLYQVVFDTEEQREVFISYPEYFETIWQEQCFVDTGIEENSMNGDYGVDIWLKRITITEQLESCKVGISAIKEDIETINGSLDEASRKELERRVQAEKEEFGENNQLPSTEFYPIYALYNSLIRHPEDAEIAYYLEEALSELIKKYSEES